MVTTGDDRVLRIDCGECALEATAACTDCVVTFLLGHEEGMPLLVRPAEVASLQALAAGGLAPVLRHRPRRHARTPGEGVRMTW